METLDGVLRPRRHFYDDSESPQAAATLLDPATGWFKQWYTGLRLAEEVRRATRYSRPLAILCIRRGANAKGGPLQSLHWVSALAAATDDFRSTDLPGKASRSEYLVILPETDEAGARVVASRLSTVLGAFEAKIGMAVLGVNGQTPAQLQDHARLAAQNSLLAA